MADLNQYLAALDRRFMSKGVNPQCDIDYERVCFRRVFRRTRFDLVAVPVFLEEHFLVTQATRVNYETLLNYSATCFAYSTQNRMANKPWKKLIGLNLFIYSVIVVDAADDGLAAEIAASLPINHTSPLVTPFGPMTLGIEIPVVYETRAGKLHHFQKVPILGNAYHREMKKVAQKWLSP